MHRTLPLLASLSCLLLTSCGLPSADKPDLTVGPKPCDPSLQADIPPEPVMPATAGIVKPPVGSAAAQSTADFLNYEADVQDWAAKVLLPRVQTAKTYCEGL